MATFLTQPVDVMMSFPKMRQKQWPIARTIRLVVRKQDVEATMPW